MYLGNKSFFFDVYDIEIIKNYNNKKKINKLKLLKCNSF